MYTADHYTGSNVSIMIGQDLVTQCAGFSIELSDSSRPIYGYRSTYVDAFTNGRKMITGQILMNFVHVNYLSTILQQYFAFRNAVEAFASRPGSDVSALWNYIVSNERTVALAGLLSALTEPGVRISDDRGVTPEIVGYNQDGTDIRTELGYARSTGRETFDASRLTNNRAQALDSALNIVFTDERTRTDLINIFTGGTMISDTEERLGLEEGNYYGRRTVFSNSSYLSPVERNVSTWESDNPLMRLASPHQFGNAGDGVRGFDMQVLFGNPKREVDQGSIYNYQGTTGFTIKGCRIIGEAMTISNTDGNIMEVYSYMAKKKVPLAVAESFGSASDGD